MFYEDFYAIELDAEMREQEEIWTTRQDEIDLQMVRAWEKQFSNMEYVNDYFKFKSNGI